MTEHDEQRALFEWAEWNRGRWPVLALMFAIPNGAAVRHQTNQRGKTFSIEGAKLKAEGLKSGIPDIFLPVPAINCHGLFIEMKTKTGAVSGAQKAWHTLLRSQGYFVTVCRGWMEARNEIVAYLLLKEEHDAKI